MNILRIVYDWPPPWSGLSPAPYEMTNSQVKMGHHVEIFSGRWPRQGDIESLPNTNIHTFYREPLSGTMLLTTAPLMFLYYLNWRRSNKPDIIHCHGHFAAWIYLYRLILKRFYPKAEELNVPLVVHFHNTVKGRWVETEESGGDIKAVSRYMEWPLALLSDRLAVKVADAMIFVSEDNRSDAIKYYQADPKKCTVVETGVNADLFTSTNPEERQKSRAELRINPEDHVILNHGVMVKRKNIHLLIEALKFLPKEYRLLLVGDGDDEYITDLQVKIDEYKLEHRVIRVGYTPYPEVPIAFQIADLFVLPSNWEGLPKVVMQSLACGTPVLASGFKLSEELMGLNYLEDLSPEHIAKRIQELINNPQEVDVFKVRGEFSWDVKAAQVDKVYAWVLQR